MHIRPLATLVAALLVGVAIGIYSHVRATGNQGVDISIQHVSIDARKGPRAPIMLIGDNLTAKPEIKRLCGGVVFVANVGPLSVEDIAPTAKQWIADQHPRAVLVAVGVNNAKAGSASPDTYEEAVQSIGTSGVPVGFVSIDQLDESKLEPGTFSAWKIDELNERLRTVAAVLHAPIAPSIRVSTVDGIRPDTAGMRAWIGNVERACPLRLGS